MRSRITLLLTALLLTCCLTACGGGSKDRNEPAADHTETDTAGQNDSAGQNSSASQNDSADQGGTTANDPLTEPGGQPAPGSTVEEPTDETTQPNAKLQGATYGQMLRNGKVHDRDGFLDDLENAVTPGTVR